MSYSAGQFSLVKIYLGAFLRAPELSGFDYWTRRLATSDIGSVADTIFSLPVVRDIYPVTGNGYTNADFVSAIYRNVFGKAADGDGLSFWTAKLDAGIGRGMLVLEMIDVGLNLPTTTPGQAYVANRYYAARYAIDRQIEDNGNISTTHLRTLMNAVNDDTVTLTNYKNDIATYSGLAAQSGTISYSATALHESSKNDGSIYDKVLITLSGDKFAGAAGASLGAVTNVPVGLEASIIKLTDTTAELSFAKTATSHATASSIRNLKVDFTNADFLSLDASRISGATRSDVAVLFYDTPADVSSGVLTTSGTLTSALVLNLDLDKFTIGGANVTLSSGSISSATNADLSGIAKATSTTTTRTTTTSTAISVQFVGDSSGNTYTASAIGDSIRGGGGNDTLIGGAGSDIYILESTAAANGADQIENFAVGTGGDILNVSQFTRKTVATGVGTVKLSTSTSPASWSNGEVVVIQGYDSGGNALDATDVEGLFGASLVLAAPTAASKLVVITCGVSGDAKVWFITNAGDPTLIETGEVVEAATLVGVNNLSVLPFAAGNFA